MNDAWKNDPTVRLLLTAIAHGEDEYAELDETKVLADALEEAGCTDQVMLVHLRNAVPCSLKMFTDKRHFRRNGCLMLEKLYKMYSLQEVLR